MGEPLDDRLKDKLTKRDRIKRHINVMLFGPYAGDCKYILRDVAKKLRKKSNIQAEICMDLPDSSTLKELSLTAPADIYNLYSSIECINTADYAVFLFLKSRQRRFEPFGPFTEDNIDMYDRPHYIPQDLNASDVIEFEKWVSRGIPNPSQCMVIYEGDVERALGSLVRGLVQKGEIRTKSVETASRGNTVQKLSSAIRGDFEAWITDNEQRLLARI